MGANATATDLKVKVTYRQILSIAMPISLAMLVPQVNMLTNNIFLGQLGGHALGNAGITGVFYLIFAVAGHGFNNGMQTVFSKYAGGGEHAEFRNILTQGIRVTLIFSLLSVLFVWFVAPFILKPLSNPIDYPAEMQFLRIRILGLPFLYLFQMGNAFLVASLNSRYLFLGFMAEAIINIVLDYLLIFGKFGLPELGFNGAAVASVIAEVSAAIFVLLVLVKTGLRKKYKLLESLKFNKSITKEVLNISAPLVFQYIISVTTWLVFFLLIEERGNTAKAISNIMRNVYGIAGIFLWSFAATSNTMVGNLMGQKKYDMVTVAIKKIVTLSLLFAIGLCITINLFPASFFKLFGQGQAFIAEAIPVIRVVSLGLLSISFANVWLNGLAGTGKTKVNLLIEVIAISIYLIYTWYIMKVNYLSLAWAWSNEMVYWIPMFILSYCYLKFGNWKPKENL